MYRSEKLKQLVRQIPCVECGAKPVQAAHSNLVEHGKGKAIKASDAAIAALCPDCHREFDNGTSLNADELEARTYRYIAQTYIALIETGLLQP